MSAASPPLAQSVPTMCSKVALSLSVRPREEARPVISLSVNLREEVLSACVRLREEGGPSAQVSTPSAKSSCRGAVCVCAPSRSGRSISRPSAHRRAAVCQSIVCQNGRSAPPGDEVQSECSPLVRPQHEERSPILHSRKGCGYLRALESGTTSVR